MSKHQVKRKDKKEGSIIIVSKVKEESDQVWKVKEAKSKNLNEFLTVTLK